MTIEEIQKARMQAEKDIRDILKRLQHETRCEIDVRVDKTTMTQIGGEHNKIIEYSVSIDILIARPSPVKYTAI